MTDSILFNLLLGTISIFDVYFFKFLFHLKRICVEKIKKVRNKVISATETYLGDTNIATVTLVTETKLKK